jgi:hypothetical protein
MSEHKTKLYESIKRLLSAVKKLHPMFAMDIPEEEECYLAYHACMFDVAEYDKSEEKSLTQQLADKDKEIERLTFMIDHGLGWEDMQNDITMPHEI